MAQGTATSANDRQAASDVELDRQLDKALEDTFPNSDPLAVTQPDSRDAERAVRERANSGFLTVAGRMLGTVAGGLIVVAALRRYMGRL